MSRNLTLSIKQNYFDDIKAGTKTFEEREIRPNNVKRYCELDAEGYVLENEKGEPKVIVYDTITFLTGAYKGTRPKMIVKVNSASVIIMTDEDGNDITYEYNGETYLASIIRYELGEIID